MGTDLSILGNHQIEFVGKSYFALGSEIRDRLNNANVPKQTSLKELFPYKTFPDTDQDSKWKFFQEDKDFLLKDNSMITIIGPSDLDIEVHKYRIDIGGGGLRYSRWFDPKFKSLQKSWRKYFNEVLNLFGSDRVIYLPDHLVYEIDDGSGRLSFSEFEKELQKSLGDSRDMKYEYETSFTIYNYFIEKFEDLNQQ